MAPEITASIIAGIFGAFITPVFAKWVGSAAKRRAAIAPAGESVAFVSPPVFSNSTFLSIFGGLMGVLLGYFLIGRLIASPCPPFSPAVVQIASPTEGTKVSRIVTVQGSSCHIAKNEELWLLVLPEGVTAYYPQAGPVNTISDGAWSASVYAGVDDPVDIGRGFLLVAAVTDHQGSAAIHSYFSQNGPDYSGLEPLPQGIKLLSQVRVVRK